MERQHSMTEMKRKTDQKHLSSSSIEVKNMEGLLKKAGKRKEIRRNEKLHTKNDSQI